MKEELITVEKLAIDLQIQSNMTSKQIMKDGDLFVHQYVLPILERILLSYKFKGNLRINEANLEIDLNRMPSKGSVFSFEEKQLEVELKRRLDQLIISKIASKENQVVKSGNFIEIFTYFLSNGSLPWYAPQDYDFDKQTNQFLESKNVKSNLKILSKHLKKTFQNNPKTFVRFIRQFDKKLIFEILTIGQYFKKSQKGTDWLIYESQSKNSILIWALLFYKTWYYPSQSTSILIELLPEFRKLQALELQNLTKSLSFLQEKNSLAKIEANPSKNLLSDLVLFQLFFEEKINAKKFLTTIKPRLVPKTKNKPIDKEIEIDEKKTNQKEITKYISNAGLIIIHPFLVNFFRKIGVLDQKNMIPNEKYDLAIHSLHYLYSGKTLPYESNLLLEKFLCGVPFEHPLDRFFELEENVKQEINRLLSAAIEHWGKLKNTSPEGLREMFFLREGKLEVENSRLYIKRMAQDILLESLPWNLSIIKFPWLKKSLFVHW